MKTTLLIATVIAATQFTGCSPKSPTNQPTSTNETNQAPTSTQDTKMSAATSANIVTNGTKGSNQQSQQPAVNNVESISVAGKGYKTSAGDIITFREDGKTAAEVNAVVNGMVVSYAGQAIYFGEDGQHPRVECTYTQDGNKITLTTVGIAGVVFTVNKDGSLTGPPEGMWKHDTFSHLEPMTAK
jgi:hypothetical protein